MIDFPDQMNKKFAPFSSFWVESVRIINQKSFLVLPKVSELFFMTCDDKIVLLKSAMVKLR